MFQHVPIGAMADSSGMFQQHQTTSRHMRKFPKQKPAQSCVSHDVNMFQACSDRIHWLTQLIVTDITSTLWRSFGITWHVSTTSDNIQKHEKSSQNGSLLRRVSAMMLLTCCSMFRWHAMAGSTEFHSHNLYFLMPKANFTLNAKLPPSTSHQTTWMVVPRGTGQEPAGPS